MSDGPSVVYGPLVLLSAEGAGHRADGDHRTGAKPREVRGNRHLVGTAGRTAKLELGDSQAVGRGGADNAAVDTNLKLLAGLGELDLDVEGLTDERRTATSWPCT